MAKRGVYGKFLIRKADGSEVDSGACYFILRLDTDEAARAAARTYAEQCGNQTLADDLLACVDYFEAPSCGCREANCPHERMLPPAWQARQPIEDIGGMSEYPRRMQRWWKEAAIRSSHEPG